MQKMLCGSQEHINKLIGDLINANLWINQYTLFTEKGEVIKLMGTDSNQAQVRYV